MQRGDVAVIWISAALAAVVAVAIAYSLLVLDRETSALVSRGSNSSWLVVTWGPGLCAVESSNPVCASGDVENMGQTMILHGLWPQPPENQYCGVPPALEDRARKFDQRDLPPLELSADVRTGLTSAMADSASLAPHEWYAHGTCAGVTPDQFFADAVALTSQVRDVLDPMFREAEGGRISLATVRERFDRQFGAGAGDRVGLGCRNTTGKGALVVDVRLSLPSVTALRTTDESLSLSKLLASAPPMAPGCRHGEVT